MKHTADQVWACAAAAHRINGGYLYSDQWNNLGDASFISKRSNRLLVLDWLSQQDFSQVTEEDRVMGRRCRDHFKGYILRILSGQPEGFIKKALQAAEKDHIGDTYTQCVIAALIEHAHRDWKRAKVDQAIKDSQRLEGSPGDQVSGEVTVVQCFWSNTYMKHRVVAVMGESFVIFWTGKELKDTVKIKGKIKEHLDDNSTRLHYVKVIG